MAIWYCGSTKYAALPVWAALTAQVAGNIVRQISPSVGSERAFICIIAGTSLASEPTWTITKGAKTAETAGPTWQECTGKTGVNGDLTNTVNWTAVKNTSVAIGTIIQRNSAGSLQICSTAGTAGNGSEPSFSNTAGTTTADNTITWTSLGAPSNFSFFNAPFARLNLSLASGAFAAAADTTYVSNNHAETQASAIAYNTWSNVMTSAAQVYSIDDSTFASPPVLSVGASIATTGANNLVWGGNQYGYGIAMSAGDGANNALLNIQGGISTDPCWLESCTLKCNTTSTTSSGLQIGSSNSGFFNLTNCTLVFGATGQTLKVSGRCNLKNPTIAATGSVPTTAITLTGPLILRVEDADLSNLTGTLYSYGTAGNLLGDVSFLNCKINASATFTNGTSSGYSNPTIRFHNCDTAANNTNYRYYYETRVGKTISETSIVHTGAATDGTTPISWNATSNAVASYVLPFISEEILQWNDTTGSAKTLTVELTTNTTLNNNDCWLELEYLGDSASPQGSMATSRMSPLQTPAALTTSTATWGGTAQTNKYKLQVTVTPQKKGPIRARLVLAKPSVTVYFDPYLSGIATPSREYLMPGMGYMNETGAAAGGMIQSRVLTGF